MWILAALKNVDHLNAIRHGLEQAGYTVDTANDGRDAERLLLSNEYDVAVVEAGLCVRDGVSIVTSVRNENVFVPLLLLSENTDVDERVAALNGGADDVLTCPFSFEELEARLRALSRRSVSGAYESERREVGPFMVNSGGQILSLDGGGVLPLRRKEFAVFDLLARRKECVVTRTVIAERVWGDLVGVTDDVINMTVSSLRRKLKQAQNDAFGRTVEIQTIHGVGYMLSIAERFGAQAAA